MSAENVNVKAGKAIDRVTQPIAVCFIICAIYWIGAGGLWPDISRLWKAPAPRAETSPEKSGATAEYEARQTELLTKVLTDAGVAPTDAVAFAADPELRRITAAGLQVRSQQPYSSQAMSPHIISFDRRVAELAAEKNR